MWQAGVFLMFLGVLIVEGIVWSYALGEVKPGNTEKRKRDGHKLILLILFVHACVLLAMGGVLLDASNVLEGEWDG